MFQALENTRFFCLSVILFVTISIILKLIPGPKCVVQLGKKLETTPHGTHVTQDELAKLERTGKFVHMLLSFQNVYFSIDFEFSVINSLFDFSTEMSDEERLQREKLSNPGKTDLFRKIKQKITSGQPMDSDDEDELAAEVERSKKLM